MIASITMRSSRRSDSPGAEAPTGNLPPRIGESPLPEEAIVTKHRYGAFESSDLDRSQGIRTVIMTGVATNVCVETLKAKSNSRTRRRPWTKAEHRELKAHSKNRTPVAKIYEQ
jgi:hypothetical protein